VRAWARSNDALAAAVAKVDELGQRLCAITFEEILDDPELGAAVAGLLVSLMIGLQQTHRPVDETRFIRMEALLFQRLLGVSSALEGSRFGTAVKIVPWTALSIRQHKARVCLSESTLIKNICSGSAPASPDRQLQNHSRVDEFFAAARSVLASRGCEAVTVAALCNSLSVTRGSFHYHFAGMENFVARMAQDWVSGRTAWLTECAEVADPLIRLGLLHEPMMSPPDFAELSWHAWGWTNRTVARSLVSFEKQWEELLFHTLTALDFQPAVASLLAEMDVALAIGLHQRRQPWELDDVVSQVVLWLEAVLGVGPGILARPPLVQTAVTGPVPSRVPLSFKNTNSDRTRVHLSPDPPLMARGGAFAGSTVTRNKVWPTATTG
jgi:AcrR family transcriptional regulator